LERFFATLKAFDDYLASDAPLQVTTEKLFRAGADALTHVGQLAMLRRVAGAPIRAENYAVAEIVAGRTGADQVAEKCWSTSDSTALLGVRDDIASQTLSVPHLVRSSTSRHDLRHRVILRSNGRSRHAPQHRQLPDMRQSIAPP